MKCVVVAYCTHLFNRYEKKAFAEVTDSQFSPILFVFVLSSLNKATPDFLKAAQTHSPIMPFT